MREARFLSNWQEEKKESSPRSARKVEETRESPLPEQIQGKKYDSESELLNDLEQYGLRDLRIVLDKEGFAVWREIPGKQHQGAVDVIQFSFDVWKQGRALQGRKAANLFVNDSFNTPKNHLRVADFAIFGADRLNGHRIRTVNRKFVNPHVVIQFSWTNDVVAEACAVDDMMQFAGVGEYMGSERPNRAYLIKAKIRRRESNSPVYGFDIFEVNQGQDTPNEPTMKYRVGAQEDTTISISPAVMGLNDDPGEPFRIEMSSIREQLEELETEFVAATEDEI